MTTQTQVETARTCVDAFREQGIEAVLPYMKGDVMVHSAPGWAGKPFFKGHDGLRELAAEWTEIFDEYGWSEASYEELGDDRVAALFRHFGRTRDGIPIDAPLAAVFEYDGDLVGCMRFFFTWEEARATSATA